MPTYRMCKDSGEGAWSAEIPVTDSASMGGVTDVRCNGREAGVTPERL